MTHPKQHGNPEGIKTHQNSFSALLRLNFLKLRPLLDAWAEEGLRNTRRIKFEPYDYGKCYTLALGSTVKEGS